MQTELRENTTHGTSVFPLQVYSHADDNGFFQVPPHWHDEFEWLYVEKGALSITVRGQDHTLGPDDFCFINAGEVHAIASLTPSVHHAVVFHPSLLDFALYDACQHNFIRPVTGGQLLFPTSCQSVRDGESRAWILTCLKQVVFLYHTLPRCALLSIRLQLLHVLESLFMCEALKENSLSEKDRLSLERLKRAIDYMKENYGQPITLQELSGLTYMTPTYFCHCFKRETGKTPIQFLNEYRIQEASRLLLESDLSVSEIAIFCGFDNFSYFIRKFREYRQITPGQYRLRERRGKSGEESGRHS